jgi:Flp pilus assembly protein CpaB
MSASTSKRSRRGLRLVVALALASMAAGGVYLYSSSVQRQVTQQEQRLQQDASTSSTLTPRVSVVVARSDVQARTPLSADAFELRDLPAEAVASAAVTSLDAIAGKVLDGPLAAGEQLTTTRLVDPQTANTNVKTVADLIPTGLRAMSLTVTELSGAGGLIVPGHHVDVVAVFKKDTLGKDEAMIMLQDVLVLAVAQATSPDELATQGTVAPPIPTPTSARAPAPTPGAIAIPGSAPKPTPAPLAPALPARAPASTEAATSPANRPPVAAVQAKTVTLAVAPEAVERLALAQEYGHLSYVIRPTSERTQQSLLPADLGTLASPLEASAAEILATEISPTNVKVGDTLTIKITIRNTSDKPLQTMGPAPGFTYIQGQTYYTQQFASQPGKWRVAIGSAGLDATELPYRWGLGADLAPGASTTVSGQIKLTADFQATNFWAAIVSEPAKIVQNGVGMTLVTAMPENVAVVAVDSANARSGPSIASSVIDQVPYGTELEIVGQSADWFKVKLPDQRVAWMAAGWIISPGR